MRTDATAHLRRTETLDANGATPYMDAVTFARILRRWRGEREQSEAAAVLGVSLRTYQNWEQSHRTPRGLALQSVLSRIGHFAKLSKTNVPAGASSKENTARGKAPGRRAAAQGSGAKRGSAQRQTFTQYRRRELKKAGYSADEILMIEHGTGIIRLLETGTPAGASSKEKRTTTKLRTAIRVSGRQKRETHGKTKNKQ